MALSDLNTQRQISFEDLIRKVIEAEGFELVDLQFKKAKARFLLRIFIDHEDGVDLNACERISKEISASLDETDLVPGSYVLEVSSPGLDRPLRKEGDFVRFKGRWIKLTFESGTKKRQTLESKILLFQDRTLTIEDREGKEQDIPFDSIIKARLLVEL